MLNIIEHLLWHTVVIRGSMDHSGVEWRGVRVQNSDILPLFPALGLGVAALCGVSDCRYKSYKH